MDFGTSNRTMQSLMHGPKWRPCIIAYSDEDYLFNGCHNFGYQLHQQNVTLAQNRINADRPREMWVPQADDERGSPAGARCARQRRHRPRAVRRGFEESQGSRDGALPLLPAPPATNHAALGGRPRGDRADHPRGHSDLSKQKSARTRRAYPEITNDMAAVLQPENGAVLLDGRDPAKEVR